MKRLLLILGILIAVTAVGIACATMGITRGAPNPVIAPESAAAPQQPTLEITYIANEGVLISSGDKQSHLTSPLPKSL